MRPWLFALLPVACAPPQQAAAPPDKPFCRQALGQEHCFETEAERRHFDSSQLAEQERQHEQAEYDATETARLEQVRLKVQAERRERLEAERRAKQETEARRRAELAAMAADKKLAVPAISALMCNIAKGPNASWADLWRDVLRERYGAVPLPCASVTYALECDADASVCTETARNVVGLWRLAERDLWAEGPRSEAPLRCCDGSDSPSCTCGGDRRGCCSHHGGVCGCSR